MKIAKWIAFGITILSGVICLLIYCVPWGIGRFFAPEAASIGIIGGADGPTAIFLSSQFFRSFIFPIIFALSLFSWLFIHFKSKKSK